MPLDVLRPPAGVPRVAVFDFDGTLSLIREGWAEIMAGLGHDLLRERGLPLPPADHLEDQMLRLSGKPSIHQMRKLADEVAARGGDRPDADGLLGEFHRRLFAAVGDRIRELEAQAVPPATWAVAGSHELLDALQARGVTLILASGTDLAHVEKELALLDLTRYFGPRVHAPRNDTPHFSKADVFAAAAAECGDGRAVASFGDGYAETVAVAAVGGTAVGVASRPRGQAGVNALKRAMLVELGAHAIVADYAAREDLLGWLFG